MPRPLHACAATLTALAVAFLAVPVRSGAQTLAETAADPDLAGRVKITKGSSPNEKGEGPTPNLAKLDAPPKRVALVSFYVADEGKATGTYYSSTRKFTWLTQDGASHFAERYYDRGLQALKEAFGRQGMQIVTHEEFLDTEAKRKAYLAYKLEMSLAVRVALGAIGNIAKAAASGEDLKQSAVAPGYRLLTTHPAATDPSLGVSLNELRQALEVDAVLIVKNGSLSDDKKVSLRDIHVMMYGPNPIPKKEGVRYIQYKDGQCYVDAVMQLKKPIEVARFEKKAIGDENYEGYEKLLATVAEGAASYLMEKINQE